MGPFASTKIVVQPVEEPITLEQAKTHLRVSDNDYDQEIQQLIYEGRRYVEQASGRALCTQTWDIRFDVFYRQIYLPFPPLQSVTSITYQDLDNATQTLSSTNYTVDIYSEPARVFQSYGGTYPATYPDLNAVTIRFVAGYGDREEIPEHYKRAIKLYVQWMYDGDANAKQLLQNIVLTDKVEWFAPEN